MSKYPVEQIPGKDFLFKFVNKKHYYEGELIMSLVFKDIDGGMSTDWSKYANPSFTKNRARNPEDNGVLKMNVQEVRDLTLTVEHTPKDDNRAHTDVIGDKTQQIQLELSRISDWAISIS